MDRYPTYEVTARRFDEYRFEKKHGGFDRAKLHDTLFDDHAEVSGGSAALYENDGEMDLLYEAVAFDWVRFYAIPDDIVENRNTLSKEEPLDFELIYDELEWEIVP